MSRLLILEDDAALGSGMQRALGGDTTVARLARTIGEAEVLLANEDFDLCLFDVNLPDGSGLEFMQVVKNRYGLPVILVTANDMEIDVVNGLELGADDYICKPFSLAILRARVNAKLRSGAVRSVVANGAASGVNGGASENMASANRYEQGEFVFDFAKMDFRKGEQRIELSKSEQKLLRLLVENRGQTLTRDALIDYVWSGDSEYVDENALYVLVKRLRAKVEDCPTKPVHIKTVYGGGYMWEC